MEEKKISLIMSIYQEPRSELKESIESILNQTYSNTEFIIVIDDPENSEGKDLIEEYRKKDKRIITILNQKNEGLVFSLNEALKIATGEYVARMDADDISETSRLEKQLEYLTKNGLDLCGSNYVMFKGDTILRTINNPTKPQNVEKMLKKTNCVAHPTWFGKKKVFDELKGYRNIKSCEDYDFLLRLVKNGYKIGNHPDILLKYRISEKGISQNNLSNQLLITTFLRHNISKIDDFTEEDINNVLTDKKYIKIKDRFNKYFDLKKEMKERRTIKTLLKCILYIDLIAHDVYLNTCRKVLK